MTEAEARGANEADTAAALASAREQQAATRAVLEAMSSGSDVKTVLQTIAEHAVRLCGAGSASVLRRKAGGAYEHVAHAGHFPMGVEEFERLKGDQRFTPEKGSLTGRVLLRRETVQIADTATDPEYDRTRAVMGIPQTMLGVPIMRDREIEGIIIVRRNRVAPFTQREIEILETFSHQAAIAIENVRLFNETKMALERSSATSEVLNVMSRAPFDLQKVLEAAIESAVRLCGADNGSIVRIEAGRTFVAAHAGTMHDRAAVDEYWATHTISADRSSVTGRVLLERRSVAIDDIYKEPEFVVRDLPGQDPRQNHSILGVPLLREGEVVGVVLLRRREIRPFTGADAALVETFADQAVIAIENVRLFNETKEALAQQTAVAGVLSAINSSRFDQQPVLDTVVERAAQLCEAQWAAICIWDGSAYVTVAWWGPHMPADYLRLMANERQLPTREHVVGRVALLGKTVQIEDVLADPEYSYPAVQEAVGYRTVLGIPLLRDGAVVGVFAMTRKEVRPFSPRQIALVETFAQQAVIAIENVRLFNETKESLGQQTALSDVLRTISRSAFDLDAVLQTIVERAAALVGAEAAAITRRDGDEAVVLAQFGSMLPASQRPGTRIPVVQRTAIGRAILTRKRQYIADAAEDPDLGQSGPRTRLVIPFLRDGTAIGTLGVTHNLPKPIGDREMKMLETFADQAAIAIENVRLFNETKEALERQTAIGEILRVIASSPTDVQPVLNAIAKSAAEFCGAPDVLVNLLEGGMNRIRAHYGNLETAPIAAPIGGASVSGQAMLERKTVQVHDLQAEAARYPFGAAASPTTRTIVASPLLRMGEPTGAIILRRSEAIPFTQRQIELAETFADQAAIAIENVRLFNETKEALKQRTATSEILRVISETLGDPQPVMQAIVDTVLAVCSADSAGFFRRSGDDLILRAVSGTWRGPRPSDVVPQLPFHGDSIVVAALEEGRYQHVADTSADPRYDAAAQWSRTRLAVPVLRGSEALGVIRVGRTAPGGFSEREIHLVRGFAEQAAIAFENARLFNETKEALERQSAVAQVLGEISQSGFQLQPVLESVIEAATKLCAAQQGFIYRRERDAFRLVVAHGITPEFKAFTEANPINPMGRGTVTGRVAEDRKTVHIPDVLADREYTYWDAQRLGNFRAILGVPMKRDNEVIGVMLLWRTEPQPFSEDQIALVTTFANQATIAIENVRLFGETTEALERQTAISEVLKVISRTTFDILPVMRTVLAHAARLCDADLAWMRRVDSNGALYESANYGRTSELTERLSQSASETLEAYQSGRASYAKSIMARVINERTRIHLADIALDPDLYENSVTARLNGARTVLAVPLLHDGDSVGMLVVARMTVRPFDEREQQLVDTFAQQAAIAMQNARLFTEIQDKSRQLEVASRHKSEFLANMSHELRTPLNAIIGFSEVLVQGLFGDVNEKQREYLHDVIGSGQHLLSLINDILDLSKIEAGRMELELSTFNFRDALQSGMTIVRERASRHNITLSVVVADELGPVEADERKVKQIFFNLLSNAVKFTPDGGNVDVTVRRDNGDVHVEVRDNGIGIAESDQARIFEEFQQVGRERSREGTGLGLTLTKRFVELHGGRITLESAPGKGSTFAFTLPLRQAAPVRA